MDGDEPYTFDGDEPYTFDEATQNPTPDLSDIDIPGEQTPTQDYDDDELTRKTGGKSKLYIVLIIVAVIVLAICTATFNKKESKPEVDETPLTALDVPSDTSTSEEQDTQDVSSDTQTSTTPNSPDPTEAPQVNEDLKVVGADGSGEEVNLSGDGNMILANETVYKDTMVIDKFVEKKDGALTPKFKGTPKKYDVQIEFTVDSDTYNKYDYYSEVSIEYRAMYLDDYLYVTDVKVVE